MSVFVAGAEFKNNNYFVAKYWRNGNAVPLQIVQVIPLPFPLLFRTMMFTQRVKNYKVPI